MSRSMICPLLSSMTSTALDKTRELSKMLSDEMEEEEEEDVEDEMKRKKADRKAVPENDAIFKVG